MPARDPFTEDQIAAMLKTNAFGIGDRLRNQTMFLSQLSFGVRISELLRLRRGDVIDGTGELRQRVTFTRTKNGSPHTVDFVNELGRDYMLRWLRHIQDHGFVLATDPVFPGHIAGKSLTRQQFNHILHRAAVEIKFPGWSGSHSCRKTWAVNTYKFYTRKNRMGEDIDPLQQLKEAGGWKTLEAAGKYIRSMLVDWRESQAALYPNLQAMLLGPDCNTVRGEKTSFQNSHMIDRAYFKVMDFNPTATNNHE